MNQPTAPRLHHARSARGVTLIEGAVVSAIVAIVASAALPGMGSLKTRQLLVNAAAEFETDVQHARSLAVSRNASLRITFDARDGASCYIVHSGASDECDCGPTADAVCRNGAEAQRVVRFPTGGNLTLNANVRSIVFDPAKGTSSPSGTVRFSTDSGTAVHQVINIMGRVRSCSPAGAVSGYKPC